MPHNIKISLRLQQFSGLTHPQVCEIFYWRDVTACFTMTYSAKDLDVFVGEILGMFTDFSWQTRIRWPCKMVSPSARCFIQFRGHHT